jgi:hypothetical protein
VDWVGLVGLSIIWELTESNSELQKFENWFFPMGPTLGEIVLTGQMRNFGIESGLGRVFKVTDHHGIDRFQFLAS